MSAASAVADFDESSRSRFYGCSTLLFDGFGTDGAMRRHPDSPVAELMRNSAVWAKLDEAKNARDLPSGYKLLDEARIELESMRGHCPSATRRSSMRMKGGNMP